MTFTMVQNGNAYSQSNTGGVSYVGLALDAPSAPGTLLVAFVENNVGGTPFKCGGNLLPRPQGLSASAVGSGGTFAAGTYFWKIAFKTANGNTQPSVEASATLVANGSANLSWPQAVSGCTGVLVYRGTTAGNENTLVTTLGGTATSYTDTGAAGTAQTPSTNNAATTGPNTQPGWIWAGTMVNGTDHQQEVWYYPRNPGNLGGVQMTNANNQNGRGFCVEFSSTLAYQFLELFPGQGGALGATTTLSASMQNSVGSGELAFATFAAKFPSPPAAGQSWTTPSGWTLAGSQANSVGQPWAAYFKVTTGIGAPSVSATYSTSTGMTSWDSLMCVFQESDSVRGPVGTAGTNAATYNDQSSFGLPATRKGSMAEFDHFMSVAAPKKTRVMAQSAACVYQKTEGGAVTTVPTDMQDYTDVGAQFLWSMRPTRALTGSALTAAQTTFDNNIAFIKQRGFFCWWACLWNEYNLGGANGYFGNDTYKPSGDPYGTGNTDATAKANWLKYWSQYQPILAAHGIQSSCSPSLSSAPSTSSWLPPAGTISGVFVHAYANTGVSQGKFIDVSPQSGVPALTDVVNGVRNPDNSVPGTPHTAIPLGVGETGRNGGSTIYAWSDVVNWSHNSSGTGHLRDLFKSRITPRTISTASVTNGSNLLNDSTASFTQADVGRPVRTANVPALTVIKSVSPGAVVGATVGKNVYSGTTETQAIAKFDGYVARPMGTSAQKIYQQEGQPASQKPTTDEKAQINSGAVILLSAKPCRTANNVYSDTAVCTNGNTCLQEKNNMTAMLNNYLAAGLNTQTLKVTLWQEPNQSSAFDTPAHYKNYLTYYITALRALGLKHIYDPIVGFTFWDPVTGYPGDSLVDGIYADYYSGAYGVASGTPKYTLDGTGSLDSGSFMALADNHSGGPVEFGLAEFNAQANTVVPNAYWTPYVTYLKNLFSSRLASGKPVGWIILYMGNIAVSQPNNEILSSSDFKIPGIQALYDAMSNGRVVMSQNATGTSGPQTATVGGFQNGMLLWFQDNIGGPNWIHTPGIVVNGVAEDQTAIQAEIAAWQDNLAPLPPSGTATLSITTSSLKAGQVGSPY